jgi:hypothetical protein
LFVGFDRNPAQRRTDFVVPEPSAVEAFPRTLQVILEAHRPSHLPFFRQVKTLPRAVASDPYFLGQIHLNYQSAMHALRAAVYRLPHLDSPTLRRRKLRLLYDDDGLPTGDGHHDRLTRAFRNIGAALVLDDEEFGEPEEMCCWLDGETAHFVRLAETLYARSLGPWCLVALMSVDWMIALAEAFAVHFPQFRDEPYFADCLSHRRGEHDAEEALAVTQTVMRARPELLPAAVHDAETIALALDGVWTQLDRIARDAWTLTASRRGRRG